MMGLQQEKVGLKYGGQARGPEVGERVWDRVTGTGAGHAQRVEAGAEL